VRTFVRFRTDAAYCLLPVEAVREVSDAQGLTSLPAARAGVVGLVRRGGRSLSVLAPFGTGKFVVIVETAGAAFGLIVQEVLGVVHVAEADVEPAPAGQLDPLVVGLVGRDGSQDLLVSPERIWERVAA
jgi:chemotaxis signal transduction protein